MTLPTSLLGVGDTQYNVQFRIESDPVDIAVQY